MSTASACVIMQMFLNALGLPPLPAPTIAALKTGQAVTLPTSKERYFVLVHRISENDALVQEITWVGTPEMVTIREGQSIRQVFTGKVGPPLRMVRGEHLWVSTPTALLIPQQQVRLPGTWIVEGRRAFGANNPAQKKIRDGSLPPTTVIAPVLRPETDKEQTRRLTGAIASKLDPHRRAATKRVAEAKTDRKPEDPKLRAEKAAASALQLALDLIDQGKKDQGRTRLEKVIKDYPGTTAAREAKLRLQKL